MPTPRATFASKSSTQPVQARKKEESQANGSDLIFIGVSALAVGADLVAVTVILVSFRQSYCPPHLLGRVSATMQAANSALVPLGTLGAGALGTIAGTASRCGRSARCSWRTDWCRWPRPCTKRSTCTPHELTRTAPASEIQHTVLRTRSDIINGLSCTNLTDTPVKP